MPIDVHGGKTRGTKLVYNSVLNHHVMPKWGKYAPRHIRTIEVEEWLKSLKLSPASKAKIRNVMSMIFRHAIRWGWLGQHENPIVMVRASTKRKKTPVILTVKEFRELLAALPDRERLMGMICATTGMRVGELLGLKWEDISFEEQTANVLRSFGVRQLAQESSPADGMQGWHHEEYRLAHVPAHIQLIARPHRQRCAAGIDATRQTEHDVGGLYPRRNRQEASGSEESR